MLLLCAISLFFFIATNKKEEVWEKGAIEIAIVEEFIIPVPSITILRRSIEPPSESSQQQQQQQQQRVSQLASKR